MSSVSPISFKRGLDEQQFFTDVAYDGAVGKRLALQNDPRYGSNGYYIARDKWTGFMQRFSFFDTQIKSLRKLFLFALIHIVAIFFPALIFYCFFASAYKAGVRRTIGEVVLSDGNCFLQ